MVLVKPKDYIVTATYFIKGETNVKGVKFERNEHRDSPSKALELAKLWKTPNIKLSLSRTISFSESRGGYISEQDSIHENISFGQLEKFSSEGENLPKRQFYVPMSVEETKLAEAAVEHVTGRPAEYVVVQ